LGLSFYYFSSRRTKTERYYLVEYTKFSYMAPISYNEILKSEASGIKGVFQCLV
jgi:hypothetical protein